MSKHKHPAAVLRNKTAFLPFIYGTSQAARRRRALDLAQAIEYSEKRGWTVMIEEDILGRSFVLRNSFSVDLWATVENDEDYFPDEVQRAECILAYLEHREAEVADWGSRGNWPEYIEGDYGQKTASASTPATVKERTTRIRDTRILSALRYRKIQTSTGYVQ